MFAYHVHEKQILLPLLAFSLITEQVKEYHSLMVAFCSFSMAKLYGMDDNYLCYPALTVAYFHFGKKLEELIIKNFRLRDEKDINIKTTE